MVTAAINFLACILWVIAICMLVKFIVLGLRKKQRK